MINNNSDIDSSSNNTIDNPIQHHVIDISTAKDLKGRSSSPRFSDISNNSVSSSGSGSSSSGVSIKSLRIDDDETQRYIIAIITIISIIIIIGSQHVKACT